jgi:O-antigen/teichoic acid export membrane protein
MNGYGDRGQVLEVCERALRIATAIVLPLSVALASVSETALSIAYGRAYAEASLAFTVLASLSILSAYASIYGSELQALGRTRPIFLAGVTSIVTYVVLLATITKPLGQVGAALARAAMIAVGFSVLHREVGAKLPSNLDKSLVVATALASTLAPIELFARTSIYLKALRGGLGLRPRSALGLQARQAIGRLRGRAIEGNDSLEGPKRQGSHDLMWSAEKSRTRGIVGSCT